MTRTALLIAAIVGIALAFALHLVYGWLPAPRRDGWDRLVERWQAEARVDRDAWPEGVGWQW